MLKTLLIFLALAQTALAKVPVREQGIASYYDPFGGNAANVRGRRVNFCPGKLACSWWGYTASPGDFFLAHRSLPCGMRVWVKNVRTQRMAQAVVLDRGTFGAIGCFRPGGLRCVPCRERRVRKRGKVRTIKLTARGWCLKTDKDEPGRWRGIADLSPALNRELEHNGFEEVQLLYTQAAYKDAQQEWQRRRDKLMEERQERLMSRGAMKVSLVVERRY